MVEVGSIYGEVLVGVCLYGCTLERAGGEIAKRSAEDFQVLRERVVGSELDIGWGLTADPVRISDEKLGFYGSVYS